MAAPLGFAFPHAPLDAEVSGPNQAGAPTTARAFHGEPRKFGSQVSSIVQGILWGLRGLRRNQVKC